MVVSKLKLERVRKGLSQADLGSRVSPPIPQWRVSLIERGITPRADEIRKIAVALDVDTGDIFPVIDSTNKG